MGKMMEKLRLNKKAVFFSTVSLFIIFLLVLDFRVMTRFNVDENKMNSQNMRIKMMNNVVYDLEERSFERILYVSGKSSLRAMSEHKDKITDMGEDFESLMLNGTFINESKVYNQYNLNSLVAGLQSQFKESELDIEKLDVNANLSQSDAWHINIDSTIKYRLSDKNKVAGWIGKLNKKISLNITGFRDPDSPSNIIKSPDWKSYSECINKGFPGGCAIYEKSFIARLDPSSETESISGNRICKSCSMS